MGLVNQWPNNPPKLRLIMRALGLDGQQRFATALQEYMQEQGKGNSTRVVKLAVNRYLDGDSGEMSIYEAWISDLAKSRGIDLPEGWSKHDFDFAHLNEAILHQRDFPLSFSHGDERFEEACRMLFEENKNKAVFKITRPSFDVDRGMTTELAYVWAESGVDGNRILFDYYFTSTEDVGLGRATENGIVKVPIDKKDIHRGSGAVQRFGSGHLWVGHNAIDGDGLIDRGRVFYFGPKNSRAADRHTHAGLVLSQRKARGNDPRCVTCIAQRCEEISFKKNERSRAKDVREHTTLRVLPEKMTQSHVRELIKAKTDEDILLLWGTLQGQSTTMSGVLEVNSNLTDLS